MAMNCRTAACAAILCQIAGAAGLTVAQRETIDRITGAKGAYTAAEDVHRVTFPRTEVKVSVDRWAMHPFMGLTSWAAFTAGVHAESMVMGDLVLFADEVNPVMSAALDNGLDVTALHNHFFYDEPKVMFMHIGGHGSIDQLSGAVRQAIDKMREIRAAAAVPPAQFPGALVPAHSSITAPAIDAILGVKGQVNSGMYKMAVGRKAIMHGREIDNQMGVNTWAAFAGSDDNAFVDGDFAMLEDEVQGVLKSLRRSGINIVAIHNHMTGEQPRYVFLHYWGKGPASQLARAIRAAMDTQHKPSANNFDSDAPGALPRGWSQAMTSTGGAPKWEVVRDDSAPSKPNVLAQTSTDDTNGRFPLAILESANVKDGEVSVRCRPISGKRDQACGVAWRYRDANNYYIARGNALENNVVLYKVEGGKRTALAPKGTPEKTYGVKHPVPTGAWSRLAVSFAGNLFTVWFNGTKLFDVEDPTFAAAGKVGLWTKADSVTHFDDFSVTER